MTFPAEVVINGICVIGCSEKNHFSFIFKCKTGVAVYDPYKVEGKILLSISEVFPMCHMFSYILLLRRKYENKEYEKMAQPLRQS